MSTLKFNQWVNPDNTENYKCRAWVNFNGTGTVTIQAAGNVSSITDNGVGDYTVNFANAMPDALFVAALSGRIDTTGADNNFPIVGEGRYARTAFAFRILTQFRSVGTTLTPMADQSNVTAAVFR